MVSRLFNYTTRAAKLFPDFVLGTSAETMGAAMRSTPGSLFTKLRAGGRALEADVAANTALHGGFFKRTFKGLASAPKDIAKAATAGANLAKMSGKSAVWGGFKGVLKGVGKKLPVIGAVVTIGLEAPNILRAFKEGGLIAGLKELGGAAVELGAMAGGAAIGSAICPGVGTVVGGIIGGLVGMFARGKTHSDKQKEINAVKEQLKTKCGLSDDEIKDIEEHKFDEKYIEQVLQEKADNQLREAGLTDEQIEVIAKNGYKEDEIAAVIEQNCINRLKQAGLSDNQIQKIAKNGYKEEDIEAAISENYNMELRAAGLTDDQIEKIAAKGYREADIQKALDENEQARRNQNMYSTYPMYNAYGYNSPYSSYGLYSNPYYLYNQYNNQGFSTSPYYLNNQYNNQGYSASPYYQFPGYGQMNYLSGNADTINPFNQYPVYN